MVGPEANHASSGFNETSLTSSQNDKRSGTAAVWIFQGPLSLQGPVCASRTQACAPPESGAPESSSSRRGSLPQGYVISSFLQFGPDNYVIGLISRDPAARPSTQHSRASLKKEKSLKKNVS